MDADLRIDLAMSYYYGMVNNMSLFIVAYRVTYSIGMIRIYWV